VGTPLTGAGAISFSGVSASRAVVTAVGSGGGGGATPIFNYANFSSRPATIDTTNAGTGYSGNNLYVVTTNDGIHDAGQAYTHATYDVTSFTTDISFSVGDSPYGTCSFVGGSSGTTMTVASMISGTIYVGTTLQNFGGQEVYVKAFGTGTGGPGTYTLSSSLSIASGSTIDALTNVGYGFCFVMQNDVKGSVAQGDSNGLGYFQYAPPTNPAGYGPLTSVCVAFNTTPPVGTGAGNFGVSPTMAGLYANCLPYIDNGVSATLDMAPQGLYGQSGNTFSAHIVYDGAILSVVFTDVGTGNKAYFEWPVDIPTIVGASTARLGVTGGVINPANVYCKSWAQYSGYNSRLATPTISPAAGQYSSGQMITISGPSGASIYYTINGSPATEASTLYTGSFTVSASTIVNAIAVQANFTDSFQAQADYQIQSSGTPTINYPSGFASSAGRIATNAVATVNGSGYIELTPSSSDGGSQTGTAFYLAPVDITALSTVFEFSMTGSPSQNALTFIINNPLPASDDTSTGVCMSGGGGPYAVGFPNYSQSAPCAGYSGIPSSLCVKFDAWNGTVGMYTGGAVPHGSDTSLSGISLTSGHLMQGTLSYNNSTTTLSLTLKDTVTSTTQNFSWTVNIPTVVNGSAAYVGFGASDYNHSTVQSVTNWTVQ
jgi:hypothetical protein